MTKTGLGRRDFLKTTLATSVVIGTGSSLALLSGCGGSSKPADGYLHLRDSDISLLTPLVPVILAEGARPNGDADIGRALKALDDMLESLAPGGRKVMAQLYDTLQLGAFRWWASGIWAHPAELTVEERGQALQAWSKKDSGFARLAFGGLTRPLLVAWYGIPDNAQTTGYPGPPKKVVS